MRGFSYEARAEHFKGVSVAAHRWRHTHAVKALEAGTDVYILSGQMGHSDVSTTGDYLKALSARQARQLAPSVLDSLIPVLSSWEKAVMFVCSNSH
jgi:integrase